MAEPLCSVAEWKALEAHYREAQQWHMREMFNDDPGRFSKFRYIATAMINIYILLLTMEVGLEQCIYMYMCNACVFATCVTIVACQPRVTF